MTLPICCSCQWISAFWLTGERCLTFPETALVPWLPKLVFRQALSVSLRNTSTWSWLVFVTRGRGFHQIVSSSWEVLWYSLWWPFLRRNHCSLGNAPELLSSKSLTNFAALEWWEKLSNDLWLCDNCNWNLFNAKVLDCALLDFVTLPRTSDHPWSNEDQPYWRLNGYSSCVAGLRLVMSWCISSGLCWYIWYSDALSIYCLPMRSCLLCWYELKLSLGPFFQLGLCISFPPRLGSLFV